MSRRSTLIVTAFAAAILMAWAGAYAADSMQAKPSAVAVVDIERVFNQLKEKKAIEADLRTRTDQLQAEEKTKKAKIADLQNALDLLPPGGDAHRSKQEELQMAVLDLRVWVQFQQQKIAAEQAIQVEGLYRSSMETIGKIAEESGYDLVLFKEPIPKFQGSNLQQIMAQLTLRKVLWSKDSAEITDMVITRMNNEHDAGG